MLSCFCLVDKKKREKKVDQKAVLGRLSRATDISREMEDSAGDFYRNEGEK